MTKEGTKVDSLYLELGIDADSFDLDFAAANKKVNEAAKKLTREQKLAKIRMDIELAGIDDADKSAEGLAARLDHLSRLMKTQFTLIDVVNQGYTETARLKGEDAGLTKLLEERLLREQKKLADLAQQARKTNAELKAVLNQPAVGNTPLKMQNEEAEDSTVSAMTTVTGAVSKAMAFVTAAYSTVLSFNWLKNVHSEAENMRLQLRVLLNDIAETQRAMAEMKQYADFTPFKTGEVVEAGKQLIAGDIKDYQAYLTLAGDWAAATGKNITETASVFSRVQAGQYGEAVERMRELNITTLDLMAQGIQFNKGGEVLNTTEELMTAVKNIVQTRFGGMTAELSQSWDGLWSTFVSNVEDAMRQLTSSGFATLKDEIKDLNSEFDKLKSAGEFEKKGIQIASVAAAINELMNSLRGPEPSQATSDFSLFDITIGAVGKTALNVALAIRQTGLAAEWMRNAVALGVTEANRLYSEHADKLNADYQKMADGLQGIKTAAVEAGAAEMDAAKKAEQAQTDAVKEALKRRQTIERDIEREKKIAETEIAVMKAYQKSAVDISKQEYDNATKWLTELEATENRVRQTMEAAGKPYRPSDAYLDAKKQFAEAEMNYLQAGIDRAEQLGQYMFEYEKTIQEVAAIEKVGGDTTVKRYAAQQQAIKDFLDVLKEYQDLSSQISVSSQQLQAALSSQSSSITDYVETNGEKIQLAGKQVMQSSEQIAAEFDRIASNEKVVNAKRLADRLSIIQQMLRSESLGAQQQRELITQEARVFAEFRQSVAQGIAENMQKIEALQNKIIGAAGTALSLLKDMGADTSRNLTELWKTTLTAWNQTSSHTLQDMQQMMSLAQQLNDAGLDVRLPFNSRDVMEAFRNTAQQSEQQIVQLKQNIADLAYLANGVGQQAAAEFFAGWNSYGQVLSQKMSEMWQTFDAGSLGQQTANTFFAPWNSAIERLKEKISGIKIEPATTPAQAVGGGSVGGFVTKTYNISIPVTVNAAVNSDNDITQLADKVAAKIQAPLVQAIQGVDDEYAIV